MARKKKITLVGIQSLINFINWNHLSSLVLAFLPQPWAPGKGYLPPLPAPPDPGTGDVVPASHSHQLIQQSCWLGWRGSCSTSLPALPGLACNVLQGYGNPRLQGQSILAEILAQMNLGLFYYWLTQAQIVLAGLISHSCIWFGFLFLFIVKIMELYLH